ncbi:MAG: hypothetical protein D6744_07780 [Planctomycetota bacterium]|nr:MAG: hypothetical protein D6744_07780 [Planctomycetota bacterium]
MARRLIECSLLFGCVVARQAIRWPKSRPKPRFRIARYDQRRRASDESSPADAPPARFRRAAFS